MKVDQGKLEDFISFIKSPHVLQGVPFGERLLKLSTGEVIKTPNVIRMMTPERIVQQYQQYCSERGFESTSKRTLHRVLDECSASVRKSPPKELRHLITWTNWSINWLTVVKRKSGREK